MLCLQRCCSRAQPRGPAGGGRIPPAGAVGAGFVPPRPTCSCTAWLPVACISRGCFLPTCCTPACCAADLASAPLAAGPPRSATSCASSSWCPCTPSAPSPRSSTPTKPSTGTPCGTGAQPGKVADCVAASCSWQGSQASRCFSRRLRCAALRRSVVLPVVVLLAAEQAARTRAAFPGPCLLLACTYCLRRGCATCPPLRPAAAAHMPPLLLVFPPATRRG